MLIRTVTVLICIALSGGAAAQTTPNSGDKPLDPLALALMGCHFEYAKAHYKSKATPAEIATASMAVCESELNAVGEDTFNKGVAMGLPLENAEGAKAQVLDRLRNYLPGFTIDNVIRFRDAK